eukprot:CAMPEP_0205817064 /NCGR_PEP_ID=MMETSP0205-20121125/23685_1 /ASSEMBLY_ACC=CAM_ASM_000278 /TAXON_ID=36767 /ORGANISM="Euplotes focardii, Strain TN1" /LENGTH=137 /DNA_ID=CAMNT_0053106703 /DNA_START=9 /DNA_END=422 /DNA_ORIENTATION=+
MNFSEANNNFLIRSNLMGMGRSDSYKYSSDIQERGFFNKTIYKNQSNKMGDFMDPINYICDQLNQDNTNFDSQIFQIDGVKSSDPSETLSLYANAEDEDDEIEEKTIDSPIVSDEKSIMELVKKQIDESSIDSLLEE